MHLDVARLALLCVRAEDRGLAVQIEVRRHADRHAEQEPRLVLLVALDGAAPPEREQEVRLHDLDGFVPLRRDAECEPLRKLREPRVQVGFRGVEFTCDGADYMTGQRMYAKLKQGKRTGCEEEGRP